LFGADLPVEGKEGGHFEWRDGPLLQALKTKSWILLDELNLASQSVLEGLNACLDHRGSVYIPELNRTFQVSSSNNSSLGSKIFGCQNPVRQGGARKGLPKSFLNRFIQVYVDSLSVEDFVFVLRKSAPDIPGPIAKLMSTFASRLHTIICQQGQFGGKGSPWDINLRDLMRWTELTVHNRSNEAFNFSLEFSPEKYVDLVYGLRMRTFKDRLKVLELFCDVQKQLFPDTCMDANSLFWGSSDLVLQYDKIICGKSVLERKGCSEFSVGSLIVLQKDMAQLEALLTCLNAGWMPILV
jgi:midasin